MLKRIIFTFLILIPVSTLSGQSKVDSLVQLGMSYFDNGRYDRSIEVMKEALKIEPSSPLVNYCIASGYMEIKDYTKALEHLDNVMAHDVDYLMGAYIIKSSCLDYLGRTDEAIVLLKDGIKKFGGHYLLYYNLGYDYYKLGDTKEAQIALESAIRSYPYHPSSHYLLGVLMYEQGKMDHSLICLHYFLLLEPNGERSEIGFGIIADYLVGPAANRKDVPQLVELSKDFVKSILEPGNIKKMAGIWSGFYAPFLNDLTRFGYADPFLYSAFRYFDPKAQIWLSENREQVNSFFDWLRKDI